MTSSIGPDRVQHRMARTFEVPATPEQVWAAIATADGLSAWMVPAQVDPTVGGAVTFDYGEFTSTGVVTACSPPDRFAYEEPWPIDADSPIPASMVEWFEAIGASPADVRRDLASVTPVATEFLVESASGGSCVVRVVSSSFGTGSDWENEFFAEMVAGWAVLLDNLATYLGRPAAGAVTS